jgi:hypothetical protein
MHCTKSFDPAALQPDQIDCRDFRLLNGYEFLYGKSTAEKRCEKYGRADGGAPANIGLSWWYDD